MSKTCQLKVLTGTRADETFTLPDEGEVLIGRHSTCLVRLKDQEMSRKQAKLTRLEGRWVIETLSKATYTVVAGHDINKPTVLNDKDKIMVGATLLEYVEAED